MASLVFKVERMPTPVGELLIVTDDDGALRGIDWTDHEARMRELLRLQYAKNVVQLIPASGSASEARSALDAYLRGDLRSLETLAVRTGGTSFQREVWGALRAIPVGKTLSYGELAARLDRPGAMRAVGMANGANPISIVVPCHRVIGVNGSLTGYGGGLPRKRWLLEHEGVRPASLLSGAVVAPLPARSASEPVAQGGAHGRGRVEQRDQRQGQCPERVAPIARKRRHVARCGQ